MRRCRVPAVAAGCLLLLAWPFASNGADDRAPVGANRNVILFVADGLRAASVNPLDAPTLDRLRRTGVWFPDSHSVYPTFTTPNASAIATGHRLGDTGDFGNTLYTGFRLYDGGGSGKPPGTPTPFLENDRVLADLNRHATENNFLTEQSLLAVARRHGYNTAAIGKVGPTAIQDVSEVAMEGGGLRTPETVIIDDSTGSDAGIPLRPSVAQALAAAGLTVATPPRDQPSGDNEHAGTRNANFVQQWFLVNALTHAVLPAFERSGKPFAVVFWSRDPDATQHNQGDSLQRFVPGINGTSSRAAIANADGNLRQILAYLEEHPALSATTDVFVTSDHGFATISKRDLDASGRPTVAYAAGFDYRDDSGRIEAARGTLPPGFLAIDLAHALGLPLFDPDAVPVEGEAGPAFVRVDPTVDRPAPGVRQRPTSGNGLIGGSGSARGMPDANVIVAAGGGSDLIYVPDGARDRVLAIAAFLTRQDYLGALFVDSAYGPVPGALPLASIDLEGSAQMPRPALVVSFRSFPQDPTRPLLSAVQIADTVLQQGQGMHGALSRDNTCNFMAAIGPGFKRGFVDPLPVGNADIAPTLATLMGFELPSRGRLVGRTLSEALAGGDTGSGASGEVEMSEPGELGKRTALVYRRLGDRRYLDAACQVDPGASQEAAMETCLPIAARNAFSYR